jgi:hypothetical protein
VQRQRHFSGGFTDTVSFIVKLWQDSDAAPSPSGGWRGQVTIVPSGERLYASKLDELPTLLASQIERAGIRLGWYWRVRILLYGWRRSWPGHR